MKSAVFTRSTGTPELRAALASPPAAKIQLPARVRRRSQVAASAKRTNQTMETGMPVTVGVPFGNLPMMSCAASQEKTPSKASPENSSRMRPSPA